MPGARSNNRTHAKKSVHAREVIRKYHGDLGIDKLEATFGITEGRLRWRLENAGQVPPGDRLLEFSEAMGIPLPELTAGFMKDAGVSFSPVGLTTAEAKVLDAVRNAWNTTGDATHDDIVNWVNILAGLADDDRKAMIAMAGRLPRQRRASATP